MFKKQMKKFLGAVSNLPVYLLLKEGNTAVSNLFTCYWKKEIQLFLTCLLVIEGRKYSCFQLVYLLLKEGNTAVSNIPFYSLVMEGNTAERLIILWGICAICISTTFLGKILFLCLKIDIFQQWFLIRVTYELMIKE